MKDLKLKKMISGQGGADCLLCEFPQSSWMDPAQIAEGFPITTSAELVEQIYNQLSTPEGNILKQKGDYEIRRG